MRAVAVLGAVAAVALVAWGAAGLSPAGPIAGGVGPSQGPTQDGGVKTTVRIQMQTVPPENAVVMWGRKPLGLTRGPRKPLVIERPRDSGPLDVVIRADGYVPVHTRAYTFTDSKLAIKLTKVADKKTLFGYREELAVPDGGVPDGGATLAGPPMPRPDAGVADR